MIASRFDYLLKVRTGDIQAYRRVLGERDLGAAACRLDLDLCGDGGGEGRRGLAERSRRAQAKAPALRYAQVRESTRKDRPGTIIGTRAA